MRPVNRCSRCGCALTRKSAGGGRVFEDKKSGHAHTLERCDAQLVAKNKRKEASDAKRAAQRRELAERRGQQSLSGGA